MQIDRNSLINITLIAVSIYVGTFVHFSGFFIWPVFLLFDDVLLYCFRISIFDSEIRIRRGYQFAHVFLNEISGRGRDLGFNLYDGDLAKTKEQSQQGKWDFMMEQLRLQPGDWLIDIGCGYGDWINYARQQGINVVGVNISAEQSQTGREQYGLNIVCTNWKDIPSTPKLREMLYHKFDAVTFMDTIEHYIPSRYRKNKEKEQEIYTNMFEMAHNLLKDETSAPKRIFISCLHQIDDLAHWRDRYYAYLLDHYHSGCYPSGDDGLTQYMKGRFREIRRLDKTEDYRITSVIDRDHFGAPKIKWTANKIFWIPVLLLLDPHHIHKWIDIHSDAWMKWHFGPHAWTKSYHRPAGNRGNARLWWIVAEKC